MNAIDLNLEQPILAVSLLNSLPPRVFQFLSKTMTTCFFYCSFHRNHFHVMLNIELAYRVLEAV